MTPPYILGFYGPSDSGKTTLIQKLVQSLTKKHYTTAVIKQSDTTHPLDTPGKDTYKHAQAGASVVVFSTPKETMYRINKSYSITDLAHFICTAEDVDIIFVEGAYDPAIPKIQIGGGTKRKNTLLCYQDDFDEALSFILKKIQHHPSDLSLHLQVNNKSIPLTEFPENIIQSTLIGMVQSLKGVNEVDSLHITLKKRKRGQ